MKIVVGLGNPGKKYTGTRHNIGFDVLFKLSETYSVDRWRSNFEAEVTEVQIGSEKVLLVAPQTFMNLSGRSVRSVVNFYKLSLNDLLLVHDDINLPTGRLRLRGTGSAGGQKGLQNTIDQLGSVEFARLRVGVGRPSESVSVVNHVLQRFTKAERVIMEECVGRAVSAIESWVKEGVDQTMNLFNQPDSKQE